MLQRFHRRKLAGGGGGHNPKLMKFQRGLDQFLGTAQIPHTPTRHSVGLGKAVDHHGTLPHSVDGGKGDEGLLGIRKLDIDLVGNDKNIRAPQHLCYGFVIGFGHYGTRGVVGVRQDQKLRFGRDCGLQRFGH